jgi:GTP pyrophosphokinase
MTVHRTDCNNLVNLKKEDSQRFLDAEWSEKLVEKRLYHTNLLIKCYDRDWLLADLTQVITDEKVKVTALAVRTEQSYAVITVTIEIGNKDHLNILFEKIKRATGAMVVTRIADITLSVN